MRRLNTTSVSSRALAVAAVSVLVSAAACSDDDSDGAYNPFGGSTNGAAPSAGTSSGGAPTGGPGGGTSSSGASSGGASSGGASSAGAPVGGTPTAGAPSGGRAGSSSGSGGAGMPNSSGGMSQSSAGTTSLGGGGTSTAGRGSGGRGGRGSGGRSGGTAGTAGSAGAPPNGAGSGGGGTCTPNIGCKLAAPPSTGDLAQDCVDRINQFRTQCACLPPLARWTEGEDCADQHAEYDSTRDAHSGFNDRICTEGGSSQNECPGYSSTNQVISLCLQQMWDEGPPPQTPCEGQCFQTYGHYINMTTTRSTKVACGFFTTSSGKVWSVQNFSR